MCCAPRLPCLLEPRALVAWPLPPDLQPIHRLLIRRRSGVSPCRRAQLALVMKECACLALRAPALRVVYARLALEVCRAGGAARSSGRCTKVDAARPRRGAAGDGAPELVLAVRECAAHSVAAAPALEVHTESGFIVRGLAARRAQLLLLGERAVHPIAALVGDGPVPGGPARIIVSAARAGLGVRRCLGLVTGRPAEVLRAMGEGAIRAAAAIAVLHPERTEVALVVERHGALLRCVRLGLAANPSTVPRLGLLHRNAAGCSSCPRRCDAQLLLSVREPASVSSIAGAVLEMPA
mmetsp:Transcript_63318/g.182126  ORF Transcript_63318/g.182126 Transcript_63318/m.182126 type:complete len:295 (-) Transcript_63318:1029-1913(-)